MGVNTFSQHWKCSCECFRNKSLCIQHGELEPVITPFQVITLYEPLVWICIVKTFQQNPIEPQSIKCPVTSLMRIWSIMWIIFSMKGKVHTNNVLVYCALLLFVLEGETIFIQETGAEMWIISMLEDKCPFHCTETHKCVE